MDEADDLLINQVDEELESALQQMERRALGADAAAGPLTADVAQVCPARFAIAFELWCMQSRNKRIRADGEEASPFWGGADNPDGSKKKVAKYNTEDKKKARQRVCQQRAGAESKQVRTLFVKRRDNLLKLGQWKEPNMFHKWLMQLAIKVLEGEGEAAAAQMPETSTLFAHVC
jgi:hypothetical protein